MNLDVHSNPLGDWKLELTSSHTERTSELTIYSYYIFANERVVRFDIYNYNLH